VRGTKRVRGFMFMARKGGRSKRFCQVHGALWEDGVTSCLRLAGSLAESAYVSLLALVDLPGIDRSQRGLVLDGESGSAV
jgi:hypothetical protein